MSQSAAISSKPVNEDSKRRAVGAQLVLPLVEVDSGLDANGGIDGRHHSGRHLDDGGVAAIQVGHQPRHIQTDPATNGDDGLLPPAFISQAE